MVFCHKKQENLCTLASLREIFFGCGNAALVYAGFIFCASCAFLRLNQL